MVAPLTTLQSVLRDQLGYTSVKDGCRQGGCGSCTVLVDGEPMLSCLLPVEDVAGRRVTTLEGLTPAEGLHPIQRAFLEANGFQCGYCTPGMEMVAKALLDHNPAPTPRRDRGRAGGQRLPLHGLRPDHRRDRGGRGRRARRRPDDRRRPPRRRRSPSSATTASASSPAAPGTRADLTFPRMLHLKMVRSPLHHARIRGVDLSEAERVPGFVRALTHADVPHNVYTILGLIGVEPEEEFVLAVDRVRYKGEPIVAILAETEAAAYEAVAQGPPRPRGAARRLRHGRGPRAGRPDRDPLGQQHLHVRGPPSAAASATATSRPGSRRPTTSSRASTGPARSSTRRSRPPAASRSPRPNGRFTVYTNTQAIYFSLDNTSIILQVPGQPAAVHRRHGGRRVRRQGGRHRGAARDAGRDEDRPPGALRLQPLRGDAGQLDAQRRDHPDQGRRDGRRDDRRPQGHGLRWTAARTAARRRTRSPSSPPTRPGRTAIPNVWIDALLRLHQPDADVRDARLRRDDGHVRDRGPDGQDRASWCGLDPWTVRFRNAHRNGDIKPHRKATADATLIETMQAAAELVGPRAGARARGDDVRAARRAGRRPLAMAKLRGTGMAAVNYPTGMNLGGDPSQALIHATTSGSFNVVLAATDLGQGLQDRRWPRSRPRRSACRTTRSWSRPPTRTPARTTWARSPAGRPTGWATRSRLAAHRGARRRARSSRRRSWRSPSSDLVLDGEGGDRRRRVARPSGWASRTSRRGPSSSTGARSPAAACG